MNSLKRLYLKVRGKDDDIILHYFFEKARWENAINRCVEKKCVLAH